MQKHAYNTYKMLRVEYLLQSDDENDTSDIFN